MTLEETLKQIKPLNEEKMKTARRRWDSIAKPLHSLGKMEDLITQIVGITGEEKVDLVLCKVEKDKGAFKNNFILLCLLTRNYRLRQD